MRTTLAATILGLTLLVSASAHAGDAPIPRPAPPGAPPATPSIAPPLAPHPPARLVRRPRAATPAPPPPRGAPANVELRIVAPAQRTGWTMRVTNQGDVPVRIVADARLLSFEATPRGAKAPLRCELPPDLRPSDDLERPMVLPPKRSYVEAFDPRLYCFGSLLNALASGTIVVARLGWSGDGAHAPYEVSSIDGVEPEIAPARSLVAPPIAVPDDPTPPLAQSSAPSVLDDSPRLVIQPAAPIEAWSSSGLSIPVTLRNDGSRTAILQFSPSTLRFDVAGTTQAQRCFWPTLPAAPTREAFTRIPPHGATSLNVVLTDYCDPASLEPGLLLVRARLDTRKASGDSIGLRTFDGEVVAASPVLVRLHGRGGGRPLVRPRPEPQ